MRGRRRRGFIIFFGHRTLHRRDGRPSVQATCPACAERATLIGRCPQRWFTFYWLPIFPLEARDEASRFTQCGRCKAKYHGTPEDFARRATGSRDANDHASAIRLFNALRERPDDSAAMLRLLAIYEAMGEPREAESSARAFPSAMAGDPRCAEALDRIRATVAASN